MNKKGFTLIELLAVVTLLAIISFLIVPAVSIVLKQSKNTIYNTQISRILNSTYDYSLKNIKLLPEDKKVNYITLGELKKKGFLDNDIKDPITGELFSDDLVISISNVGSKYKSNDKYEMLNGYYLYKIESEFMKSSNFNDNKPLIIFEGYDKYPIVINLNVGSNFEMPKYLAISMEGIDLTAKVIENIIYNSNIVDEINSDDVGIYYINYSVVDDNGYSNFAQISVIIVDNEKPTLEIPDNDTLSIDTTDYNLLEGVSCNDNSGKCEIKVSGNINFGVAGKNIIEYTASDPTGNTTIIKRVITVE